MEGPVETLKVQKENVDASPEKLKQNGVKDDVATNGKTETQKRKSLEGGDADIIECKKLKADEKVVEKVEEDVVKEVEEEKKEEENGKEAVVDGEDSKTTEKKEEEEKETTDAEKKEEEKSEEKKEEDKKEKEEESKDGVTEEAKE